MKHARLAALATMTTIVLGGVSGCSNLGHEVFKQPTVSLQRVRVTGIGVTGGSIEVDLKVFNPNVYSLNGTNFHYQVNVDSTPLAHGAIEHKFSVPRKDSTVIGIPVAFSFNGVGAAGRSVWAAGLLNYHVTGDVTVITPIGDFTVPFKTDGEFSTIHGVP